MINLGTLGKPRKAKRRKSISSPKEIMQLTPIVDRVTADGRVHRGYRDHSTAQDELSSLALHKGLPIELRSFLPSLLFPTTRGNEVMFPVKLHDALNHAEKAGLSSIVSWQPHGRCFLVHDQNAFVEEVLKKSFFKQTKFPSFQRQLNIYGFKRITKGKDKGGYYHELFLRGKRFLAHRIQRYKIKGTKVRQPSTPETEPHFYSMPFMAQSEDDGDVTKQLPMNKCYVLSPPGTAMATIPPTYTETGSHADFANKSETHDPAQSRVSSYWSQPPSADLRGPLSSPASPYIASQLVVAHARPGENVSRQNTPVEEAAVLSPPNKVLSPLMKPPPLVNMSSKRVPACQAKKELTAAASQANLLKDSESVPPPFILARRVAIPLPELTPPLEVRLAPTTTPGSLKSFPCGPPGSRTLHFPNLFLEPRAQALISTMPRPVSDMDLTSHNETFANSHQARSMTPPQELPQDDDDDDESVDDTTHDGNVAMTQEGLPADEELEQFVVYCMTTHTDR